MIFFNNNLQGYLFVLFFVFAKAILGIFTFSSKYIFWLPIYALLVPITIYIGTNKPLQKLKNKLAEKTRKKVNESSFAFVLASTSLAYFWVLRIAFIFIFVSFSSVIVGFISFQIGQEEAKSQIENFSPCDIEVESKTNNCVFIYKGDIETLSGLLIAKSESHIGVWDGKNSIIYPIKDEIVIIKKAKRKTSQK